MKGSISIDELQTAAPGRRTRTWTTSIFYFFCETTLAKKTDDEEEEKPPFLEEAINVFQRYISGDELQSVLSRLGLWEEGGSSGDSRETRIGIYDGNSDERIQEHDESSQSRQKQTAARLG
ncbi:hypothetical protein M569_13350 [Genlisea aurea]|uniref:Uncharacterized protein n=1 Tax=Genlisea aurea TaxID=192259 RepID=S8C472_9LAMI|nr:hypothetical protein M569_13350 [Genlisea aurea]